MSSTPARSTRGRKEQKHAYKLRRRILGPEDEDDDDSEKSGTSDEKEYETITTTQSDTSTAEESARRSNLAISQSSDVTQFHKSVLTPSRVRSRRQSVAQSSIYRTPHISSIVKKVYTVKKGKKVPNLYKNKWKEDVQRILKRTWKICYLSSVFKFNFQRKNLKAAYEKTLKERILEVYPSYHLVVEIAPSSFLFQNIKETDSLFFKVDSLSPGETSEENRMVTVYESVLIKAHETKGMTLTGGEWFPLMLFSGREAIHNAFIRWLQVSFGCYVTPRCLPLTTILWVAGVWSHGKCSNKQHKESGDREIMLHYHIRPASQLTFDSPNNKGRLSLKFRCKATTLINIWEKIKKGEKEVLSAEDLARFHCVVESYLESVTNLPKSLLHLAQIKTPCVTFAGTGAVRMGCDTSFLSMLHHLIEIFQHTCHFKNVNCDDSQIEVDTDLDEETDE